MVRYGEVSGVEQWAGNPYLLVIRSNYGHILYRFRYKRRHYLKNEKNGSNLHFLAVLSSAIEAVTVGIL